MSMVKRAKCLEREDDARDNERSDDTGGNSEFISNQLKERCLAMGKNQKRFNVNSKGDGCGERSPRGGGWAWRGPSVAVACAAVLLLLPFGGKAWAQNSACGAPASDGEVSCDPSEVGSGVRYWQAYPSLGGPLTLKILGTSTSSTAVPSIDAGNNQIFSSPVAISHNDDLTVEIGTEGRVALTQSFTSAAHGLAVRLAGATTADVVKVNVGSGVTIGTQTARMLENGIQVEIWSSGDNTADHSVSSGATIYAMKNGLHVVSDSRGKMSVTNTGDVTAGERGLNLVNPGGVDLMNSGDITSGSDTATGAHGIYVQKAGMGPVMLENRGAITAKGINTHGIFVDTPVWGSSTGDITVTNNEGATITAPGYGILVAQSGTADTTVTNRGVIMSGSATAATGGHGIYVQQRGTGAVTVDNSAAITAKGMSDTHGIAIDAWSATRSGDITVTNTGAITAPRYGIKVYQGGTAHTTVTNRGVIMSGSATAATGGHGIYVEQGGTGAVTVENFAAITAKGMRTNTHGIFLDTQLNPQSATRSGDITVTNEGAITAPGFGIHVRQRGTAADTTVTNRGAIRGSVHGIYVQRFGVSDITIETSADITSSVYGIYAELRGGGGDGDNPRTSTLDVTVEDGATVTGGNGGIYVTALGLGENDVVNPTVTVHGTVTGGKDAADAAVTLAQGGRITVGQTGHVKAGESGVAIVSGRDAGGLTARVSGTVTGDIRTMDGGDLTLTVLKYGTVTGDIRTMGVGDLVDGGDLTLTVQEGGTVTGTAYDPIGSLREGSVGRFTVEGSVGRLMYTNGGKVTVAQTGRITGVEGQTAAIQSEAGDLDVTVAGRVMGNIRGMGAGKQAVVVERGGMVTGTIHLDGSTVTNHGTISGEDYGVRVAADSTVTNSGTIEAKTPIQAGAGSTVTNSGTVSSTDEWDGLAIRVSEGKNTLTLRRGMTVVGKIQGLSGDDDTIDLSDLAADEVGILTFVDEKGNPVNLNKIDGLTMPTRRGIGHTIRGGGMIVSLDATAFALTDDMLSDLTGSIHGAVVERGMRPGRDDSGRTTVWATPFGGARNQNGAGTVADGTHSFGGGIVGTGWSTSTLRVGGFLGGSVGMIDVDSKQDPNVDVQTIFGGLYAQRAVGDVIYDVRLLMGRMTSDSTRRVPSDTIEVEYHSFFFSPEVGMATTVRLTDTLGVLPRVRVRYAGLFTNGFRESGEMSGWDVQFQDRTVHVVEGRAEVGLPFALANGGRINPRVGVEGRWLLSGSEIRGAVGGQSFRPIDAGGDDQVVTGLAGVEVSLPVADATTLVGSFDGALTTEDAWRALGYLGLSYSF